MSNKKPQGQLRRELLMLILRHSLRGIKVNCSGGLALDDDLKRLIREGAVTLERVNSARTVLTKSSGRRISRYHLARPSDGVFLTTWPACPCCGVVAESVWRIQHAINCSLRTDHRGDSGRNRNSSSRVSLEPRRQQNRG